MKEGPPEPSRFDLTIATWASYPYNDDPTTTTKIERKEGTKDHCSDVEFSPSLSDSYALSWYSFYATDTSQDPLQSFRRAAAISMFSFSTFSTTHKSTNTPTPTMALGHPFNPSSLPSIHSTAPPHGALLDTMPPVMKEPKRNSQPFFNLPKNNLSHHQQPVYKQSDQSLSVLQPSTHHDDKSSNHTKSFCPNRWYIQWSYHPKLFHQQSICWPQPSHSTSVCRHQPRHPISVSQQSVCWQQPSHPHSVSISSCVSNS
jgi:hypothetical protein